MTNDENRNINERNEEKKYRRHNQSLSQRREREREKNLSSLDIFLTGDRREE